MKVHLPFEFAQPKMLFAIVLAGLAMWWSLQNSGRVVFSSLRALPGGGETWRTRLWWLPDLFTALAIVAFVVAIAGPRKGMESARIPKDGIGIAMAIDVSGSMQAQDLAEGKNAARCNWDAAHDPTRLGVVKRAFEQFVIGSRSLGGRPDDAVGLIAFAHYAETRSPLTLDHDNLVTAAEQLDFAQGEDDGTAIGAGLELAVTRLVEWKPNDKSVGRVAILLTDGDSNIHEIDEDAAIDDAVKAGVKVYTIGAGSTGIAPVCADGRLVQMRSGFDESMLRKVAAKTGGQFFRAEDASSLQRIYGQIDKLERTRIEETRFTEYRQYYAYFVAAGLLLIVASLLTRATVLRRLP